MTSATKPHVEHLSRGTFEHLLEAPSLAKLIDGFLVTLRSEGKSPNTIFYHQWLLGKFLWWCEQGNASTDAEHITTAHIRELLIYVQREPIRWG